MDRDKLIAGVSAVAIYLLIVGSVIFYFKSEEKKKIIHYVKKSSDAISVSLTEPSVAKVVNPNKGKKRHSKRVKKETKHKRYHKPKPKPKPKHKPKSKPKPKPKSKPKPKKPDAKKLFSSIKQPPSETTKKQNSTSTNSNLSKNQKAKDKGIEDSYLARVERTLRGWPAQANFAGEEIDIKLQIYQDGHFNFDILKLSMNPAFNHELIKYLEQLQRIGLGRHTRPQPYNIEVKFIAHD